MWCDRCYREERETLRREEHADRLRELGIIAPTNGDSEQLWSLICFHKDLGKYVEAVWWTMTGKSVYRSVPTVDDGYPFPTRVYAPLPAFDRFISRIMVGSPKLSARVVEQERERNDVAESRMSEEELKDMRSSVGGGTGWQAFVTNRRSINQNDDYAKIAGALEKQFGQYMDGEVPSAIAEIRIGPGHHPKQ